MSWLLHQLPSFGLVCWGAIGFVFAGNKRRWAWMSGFVSEFAWALYSIWLHQYGLLIGCVFYGVVYWRNWVKWGKA